MRRIAIGKPSDDWPSNEVTNTKYTPWTFIPLNLMGQFSRHMNRYFLLIGILQLFPSITPVDPITTWFPLGLVFSITAAREGFDDVKRRRADRLANARPTVVFRGGERCTVPAAEVRVGDLVQVFRDAEVPCDLVLLKAAVGEARRRSGTGTGAGDGNGDSADGGGGGHGGGGGGGGGSCFVETSNIDGETDLKSRHALVETAAMSLEQVARLRGTIECEAPNAHVYRFNATLHADLGAAPARDGAGGGEAAGRPGVHPLSAAALLQQGTIVRKTAWAVGVAVYTGNQTKVGMNKTAPPTKLAKADSTINRFAVYVFVAQLALAFTMGTVGHNWHWNMNPGAWYLHWGAGAEGHSSMASWAVLTARMLLLTSMMVPISLKVNLDLIKLFYSKLIDWDVAMYDAETDTPAHASNTAISEDLGQVGYVLTDKTGTLTDNVMAFRACAVAGAELGDGSAGGRRGRRSSSGGSASAASPSSPAASGAAGAPASARSPRRGRSDPWSASVVFGSLPASDDASGRARVVADTSSEVWSAGRDGAAATRQLSRRGTKGGPVSATVGVGGAIAVSTMGVQAASGGGGSGGGGGGGGGVRAGAGSGMGVDSVAHGRRVDRQLRGAVRRSDAAVLAFLRCLALNNSVSVGDLPPPSAATDDPAGGGGRGGTSRNERRLRSRSFQSVEEEVEGDCDGDGDDVHDTAASLGSPGRASRGDGAAASDTAATLVYEGSSPDEEALVKGAADAGVVLTSREPGRRGTETVTLQVRGAGGGLEEERYEVVHVLPFTSERKRMSVVVRVLDADESAAPARLVPHQARGGPGAGAGTGAGLVLLMKGADDVVFQRLHANELAALRAAEREAGTGDDGDLDTVDNGPDADGFGAGSKAADAAAAAGDTSRDGSGRGRDGGGGAASVKHALDIFASRGLRTLCVAARAIPQHEYEAWLPSLRAAEAVVGADRDAAVLAAYDQLERDLRMVGCTAVEDRLQRDVPGTIHRMRQAGVRFWMLTGDRYSTAVNIGKSARLLTAVPGHGPSSGLPCVMTVRAGVDEEVWRAVEVAHAQQAKLHRLGVPSTLVVEGSAVEAALRSATAGEYFRAMSLSAASVIVCRATPKQKAMLVQVVRAAGHTALAIGDGGNDCAMILEADVGVGISGREGLQAARAADYTMAQFRFLERLCMVHGRYSLYRTSWVAQYCFYKSLFIAFLQLLYNGTCGVSGCSLLSSYSLVMYNTAFTAAAPLFFVFDRDTPVEVLLRVPALYADSIRSKWMTAGTFAAWFARAAVQSLIIYAVIAYALPPGGGMDGASVDRQQLALSAFSVCVLVQIVTVAGEANSPTLIQHLGNAACLAGFVVLTLAYSSLHWSKLYGAFWFVLTSHRSFFAVVLTTVVAVAPWLAAALLRLRGAGAEHSPLLGADGASGGGGGGRGVVGGVAVGGVGAGARAGGSISDSSAALTRAHVLVARSGSGFTEGSEGGASEGGDLEAGVRRPLLAAAPTPGTPGGSIG